MSSDYSMYGVIIQMSVSILFPVLMRSESTSEVLFVDFSTMSVHHVTGNAASEEVHERVLSEIRSQQESSSAKVPYEQIHEVMHTEKKLSQDNAKHVFRRTPNG